ncbi:MAG: hypothetical protein PHP23_05790 [Desulfobacterales bacterium]|nr:hypothetical protein [Desulfobacterales bacterium]MDD4072315.1 hypothetical protein [Desulfobacterales bacterium]MDD4393680.1 hypothetical protein [Desulfobacterales bacterium]
MNNKEIFGCAAFGLADRVFQVEGETSAGSFYLADAVLPVRPSGIICTGDTAEQERIHSGLYWPPEARIRQGTFLRRAPIPCVWRALVEAGDRSACWQVGGGVSFTLSRIISAHVVDLLTKSGCRPQDTAVLAIPDALDEFGQEALLRDLKICGFENVQLLWRPVAAAISWLSELDQNNAFDVDTDAKEHIIVVYLGPDGVEMTTFQLHREKYDNTIFVIPVRERPRHVSSLTGFDWAANALDAAYPEMDDGAFWQAFTNFPHVWEAMSDRPFSSDRDVWSLKDHWIFWSPNETLNKCARKASAVPNTRLRSLLGNSCRLFTVASGEEERDAGGHFAKLFTNVLDSQPQSRLRGVIVAGPLCPLQLPQWILSASDKLRSRGIKVASASPQLDTIWLAHGENALVDGCAEYGRRLDMGLPTYLDTLPKLSVLVEQRGDHVWVELLNAETCEGGKPFKPAPIQSKFAIQPGAQQLQVFLKKGGMLVRSVLHTPEELAEQGAALSTTKRAEIDAKVLQTGSYEKVLNAFANSENAEGRYAKRLAIEMFGNPFRRAEFAFPSVPEQHIPVDVSVEIRPASGLAQITLVPSDSEDSAFLRGRQIFLDYSTMEEADPPPPPTRGWPDVVKLEIDPNASFLETNSWVIKKYLHAKPDEIRFIDTVEDIKKALTWVTNNFSDKGFECLRPIDQDGIAGTKEASRMITAIANKAASDFPRVRQDYRRKFVTRVSWLFAKTPENVKKEIRKYISQRHYDNKWTYGVEAAGRIFTAKEDFQLLYTQIFRRLKSTHAIPFPIHSYKALWRLLSLREYSPMAMTPRQAKTFTEETVKMMAREACDGNYKQRFFQAARLFLFLLRFRVVVQGFLDPDKYSDSDLFERAIECLRKAENHFSRSHESGADRARELVIGIEKFMYYEGSNDILTALDSLAGGD